MKLPNKFRRTQEFIALAMAYVIDKGMNYDSTGASPETALLLALHEACRDVLSRHTLKARNGIAMYTRSTPLMSSALRLDGAGSQTDDPNPLSETVTANWECYSAEPRQDALLQDDRSSSIESKAIDNERSPKEAISPVPLTLILNVGREFSHLNLQALVLRARGYVVESALSPESAIKCFKQGDFDLILLCHSISLWDRNNFIEAIRAYGSRVPIVCLPPSSTCICLSDKLHTTRRLLDIISLVIKNTPTHPAMCETVYPQNFESYRSKTFPMPKAVLYIHDNQALHNIERRLLGEAGYLVLTTPNCIDCINIFSTGIADAVVFSFSLSAGNAGVLATQMRQKMKDVPLILVSGSETIPDLDKPLFDHILHKNCSPRVLPQLLGDLFQRTCHAPIVGR